MQDKMFDLGSNTACLRLPLHQQGLSTLAGTGKYRTSAKRQESHGANAKDYPWLRGKEELQYMPKKKTAPKHDRERAEEPRNRTGIHLKPEKRTADSKSGG